MNYRKFHNETSSSPVTRVVVQPEGEWLTAHAVESVEGGSVGCAEGAGPGLVTEPALHHLAKI
jgi:hypothetical protein